MAKVAYKPSAPGAQTPGKYPFTGPHYQQWGEQQGWIYNPWNDRYTPDPKIQEDLYKQQGLVEEDPKAVSPYAAVLPAAVVASSPALVEMGGGLLGIGSAGASTASGATSLGTSALAETPAIISSGLEPFGIGATGEAATVASGTGETAGLLGAATPYLGAAGAGLGAYGIYNATQMEDKKKGVMGGLLSGAGMGAGASMALPLLGIGSGGTLIPFIAGGAALGGLLGATAHKTTKTRSKERWGGLDSGDAAWEAFRQKGLELSTGKGASDWDLGDDKSQAPIDELINSYGIAQTMGPEWLKYSPEQQRKIAQEMVNKDLFNSKQGEFLVTDPTAAKAIAASVGQAGAAFDASGKRLRPWQPGDPVYGNR